MVSGIACLMRRKKMSHEDLYFQAESAIKELYNDTSVSQEETKVALQTLIGEIEILLDTLE